MGDSTQSNPGERGSGWAEVPMLPAELLRFTAAPGERRRGMTFARLGANFGAIITTPTDKQMNRFKRITTLVVVAWWVTATTALAQTLGSDPVQPATIGQVIQPPDLKALPLNPTDVSLTSTRPERPERPALSPEILEQLRSKFEFSRESYLKRQEELKRLLQGATEAQRKLVRDQIKESRQRWLEQAREFRDEAKDRARELRRQLPKLREALDESRQQLLDATTSSTRKRPGLDGR